MLLNRYNKLNITFCGMMGSGKSIIGNKFAKLIDFNHVDTDILIEETVGKSINEIFKISGEYYFRKLEEKIISELLLNKNYVLSLGGGVLTNKKLRNIIKKNSFNIYLKVDINILRNRLKSSKKRPLINKKDNIEEILFELINKREKYYKKANLIVNNNGKISETINDLKKFFKIYE